VLFYFDAVFIDQFGMQSSITELGKFLKPKPKQ